MKNLLAIILMSLLMCSCTKSDESNSYFSSYAYEMLESDSVRFIVSLSFLSKDRVHVMIGDVDNSTFTGDETDMTFSSDEDNNVSVLLEGKEIMKGKMSQDKTFIDLTIISSPGPVWNEYSKKNSWPTNFTLKGVKECSTL